MILRVIKLFAMCSLLSIVTSCVSNDVVDYQALAPSISQHPGGIVQVYAARTWGAKEALAVHTWISTKKAGEDHYTSYEIIGWRLRHNSSALVVRKTKPDRDWWGHAPQLLLDYRKDNANEVIDKIRQAVTDYPFKDTYHAWPGPNSNTFTAYIGKEVSELRMDLPSTAIGKDYRGITYIVGMSPSGTGIQASFFGLLSLTLGYEEGFELNILGLNVEIDLFDLAIELPGIGRIGPDPVEQE
ncbi:MAG: DUF3750 domain-containing protein [Algicola sp.]|nr:DUF3750 domain-containing protein [Algicola sp.]